MPYFRKSTRFTRSTRSGTKKYSRKSRRRVVSRYPTRRLRTPFPTYRFVKLKYAETYTKAITTGTPVAHLWGMNNLSDPNQTGSGHQPYWFDQLASNYLYYTCYGCKVTIQWMSDQPTKLVIRPSMDTTTPTNIDLEEERPYSSSQVFNTGGPSRKISRYYKLYSIAGCSKNRYLADDQYSALFTSAPSNVVNLVTMMNTMDASSSADVNINITFTFYTKVFDRKPVNQS